jgi:hypothetical protein
MLLEQLHLFKIQELLQDEIRFLQKYLVLSGERNIINTTDNIIDDYYKHTCHARILINKRKELLSRVKHKICDLAIHG